MYPLYNQHKQNQRGCHKPRCQVQVNGQTELQRGKKLHDGDVVTYDGETIQIVK